MNKVISSGHQLAQRKHSKLKDPFFLSFTAAGLNPFCRLRHWGLLSPLNNLSIRCEIPLY
jgi:hypothetical protein